ncbi:MAG: DUF4143 domain-containing protein, partial [Alphaproteobacteria bacterium]|nr:DUF4143 domain-containing protein [Alphaproteobacteria bacterium]
ALCGSSARKLKQLDANLLAGRAINRAFFPLVCAELPRLPVTDDVLRWGLLPEVRSDLVSAADILEAYAANYLREQIQQEVLTKDLASFARFLRVAGLLNGQVVTVTNIARESAVVRPTVQRYFDVLVDTLIGVWLPARQPRIKVCESAYPRFYLFDCGVVRAVCGRLRALLHKSERGPALETLMLHEIRAHLAHHAVGGELSHYRTAARVEMDFIWQGPERAVGIEVKAARVCRRSDGAALLDLLERNVIQAAVAVYGGDHPLKDGAARVWPSSPPCLAASQVVYDRLSTSRRRFRS